MILVAMLMGLALQKVDNKPAAEANAPPIATPNPSANAGPLVYPMFLAAKSDDTVVVSDLDGSAIVEVNVQTGVCKTIFKADKRLRTPLNRPRGLALASNGDIVAACPATMDVYRISAGKANGFTGKLATAKAGNQFLVGSIVQPEGVAIDSAGAIYVSDIKMNRIVRIEGNQAKPFAEVKSPRGLLVDADGKSLIVLSNSEQQLIKLDASGKATPIVASAPMQLPMSIARTKTGEYVVADSLGGSIWKIKPTGEAERWLTGNPLLGPTGVAVLTSGDIIVCEPKQSALFRVTPTKTITPINLKL